MSSPGQIDDEREFEAAFEEGTYGRKQTGRVRDNDPSLTRLELSSFVKHLGNPLQWRLIGRYVARNTHLRVIDLGELTDQYMPHLFSELPQCPHLVELRSARPQQLYFGREGVESMVPFLRNSRNLPSLSIVHNPRMDDACFRLIVGALDGGSIERLVMAVCRGITDVTPLRNCTFPHLKVLNLNSNMVSAGLSSLEHLHSLEELQLGNNGIGLEQCIDLVGLLRNPNASLRKLGLQSNKLCDESIEALAGALKDNSTLEELNIDSTTIRISERGCLALLKLLLDVSSIDSTYNSNHTLVDVHMHNEFDPEAQRMKTLFKETLAINELYRAMPEKAGQIKVLRNQLNSIGRKEMCDAQGVEFASTGSILANIDSYLLPNVLALVGGLVGGSNYICLGQAELFNVLVETAPDLMALIDRKALMENLLARKMVQIAALTVEADSLSRRLRLLKGGDEPGAKKMRRC